MLPDRVSNPGPQTYESGALPIALRGPARCVVISYYWLQVVRTAVACAILARTYAFEPSSETVAPRYLSE